VKVDIENLRIDSKRAVSLGIIANELLTDAFKYAFPDDRGGTITIALRREGAETLFEVADDGIGLPPDFSEAGSAGFGLKLVRHLALDLRGRLEIGSGGDGRGGSRYRLAFPL
jgi:two-component sensor histidine kinase